MQSLSLSHNALHTKADPVRPVTGTGKTLLARAAAAECGASFLAIQPSTVTSKWFGDSVRYVKAAFSLAAKLPPCVLFVDEVRLQGSWPAGVLAGLQEHAAAA